MVDGHVQENPRLAPVHRIHQFPKLVQRGGPPVEFGQRGIHIQEIQRRKRTPKPPHARIGGGHRMDRQQLHNAEPQITHDHIQPADQVTERAGPWNHRVSRRIQLPQQVRTARGWTARSGILPKLADKGAVEAVGAPGARGFHLDHRVAARGPDRLGLAGRQEQRLGFKPAHLEQRQGHRIPSGSHPAQGNIMPVMGQDRRTPFDKLHPFPRPNRRTPDVRPQPAGAAGIPPQVQREGHPVTGMPDHACPRRGNLLERVCHHVVKPQGVGDCNVRNVTIPIGNPHHVFFQSVHDSGRRERWTIQEFPTRYPFARASP